MKALLKEQPQKEQAVEPPFRIFLVEDDKILLHAIGHKLYEKNINRVHCFTTGQECIDNLKLKPDIIILDYYLSDDRPELQNGIAVLKAIKKESPDTIVVMLSAQKDLAVAVNSLKEGAYSYLIKNNQTLSQLREILRDVMNNTKL